jgi:hypothetical protein
LLLQVLPLLIANLPQVWRQLPEWQQQQQQLLLLSQQVAAAVLPVVEMLGRQQGGLWAS